MHYESIAQQLLPPVPNGHKLGVRSLPGHRRVQHFVAGGFFKADAPKQDFKNLAKTALLSLDIDGCDCPAVQVALGFEDVSTDEDRKAVKQALYAMEEEEVHECFDNVGFVQWALKLCVEDGLPDNPNRVLFSGHGYQLIWWLTDNMGWSDSDWNQKRLKNVLSNYIKVAQPVHVDAGAKDIGTRIMPIPGFSHRNADKMVCIVGDRHDEPHDLSDWFAALEAKYPSARKAGKRRRQAPRQKGQPSTGQWSSTLWLKGQHPELPEGDRDTCPLCGGSGYKRMDERTYACFSCNTHFKVPVLPSPPPAVVNGVRKIDLDANGRMILPPERPNYVVLKTATASGKTHFMAEIARKHDKGWAPHKKVLAISPFKSLAQQQAGRFNIQWASSGSDNSLRQSSCAMTMAALESKANVYKTDQCEHLCVMFDESETVLSQLGSMLTNGKDRDAYNSALRICLRAARVVLADQNAGPATAQFIAHLNAARASNGLPARDFEWWVSDHYRHTFLEIQPVLRTNRRGEEVVQQSSTSVHEDLIMSQIDAELKVAVYRWGHSKCIAQAAVIRAAHPALDVRVVVGTKSKDSENDLSQAALTADVLIYNNAMSTGVSIDALDHYDHVHVLCENHNSLSGDHVEQACHRVRNPKSREIFISGADRAIVNDWRCDPQQVLDRKLAELDREDATCQRIMRDKTFTLRGDYHVSADAQRLTWLQAVVVASEHRRGKGWPLEYLRSRHTFKTFTAATHADDIAGAVKAAVEQVKLADAQAVALSTPLSDTALDRVTKSGADTDQEADEAQAARMCKRYGDAYAAVNGEEKTRLVLEHKKGLYKQVAVFAQYRCWGDLAHAHASLRNLKKSMKHRTAMTSEIPVNKAVLFYALMLELEALRVSGATEIQISRAQALVVCTALQRRARTAGLPMRRGWQANPVQQLGAWLKLAGLSWDARQVGPRGARTREYWLTDACVTRMERLSEKRFNDVNTVTVDKYAAGEAEWR